MRFWDASGVALTPLYKLGTANVFHTDCDPADDPQDPGDDADMQQEDEWPPFRKVPGCSFVLYSTTSVARLFHPLAFHPRPIAAVIKACCDEPTVISIKRFCSATFFLIYLFFKFFQLNCVRHWTHMVNIRMDFLVECGSGSLKMSRS